MILVAIFLSLLSFVVGMRMVGDLAGSRAGRSMNITAQADNAARGGIVDAIGWFRKQVRQPVRSLGTIPHFAFFPTAAKCETMEENNGLVKEYPLDANNASSGLWARYEVLRANNTKGVQEFVEDISLEKLPDYSREDALGNVWALVSVGYVYRRYDFSMSGSAFTVPFDQPPNKILARSKMRTELRRVSLKTEHEGALALKDQSNLNIGPNGSISAGRAIGMVYNMTSGAPASIARIFASAPKVRRSNIGLFRAPVVFQLPVGELKQTADIIIKNPAPPPPFLPPMAVTFCEGDCTFDDTHTLSGSGVLFVNGNLDVSATIPMNFGGVIYVTGSATINGPVTISGHMVVENGSFNLGTTSGPALLSMDTNIPSSVRGQILQYRETRAARFAGNRLGGDVNPNSTALLNQ